MATRTAPFPDRGIAAGACATAPPGSLDSSVVSFRHPWFLLPAQSRTRALRGWLPLARASSLPRHHVTLRLPAMRILDRYIVLEVIRHALLGLIIFTFVLFVPKLVCLMELFVRHSGSGSQIGVLFLCIVPNILVFSIPMAVLIGVLLGLGRMSMD